MLANAEDPRVNYNHDQFIAGLSEVSMGTTILGMKFNDGVILCADSRTSSGQVVVNRVAKKLTRICHNMALCRCGSAADTQTIARILKYLSMKNTIEKHSLDLQLPLHDVKSIAYSAHTICHNNRDNLSAGFILGGVDDINGPQVYNITPGGAIFASNFACSGSGSTYIAGLLDHLFKENLDVEQALELAITLVNHAIMRDGSSGGIIRFMIITREGIKEDYVSSVDVKKLEEVVHL